MAEVIWTARAIKDINEIAEYISKDSFRYAGEQVLQFFEKTKLLEKHPLIGRVVPEVKISSIRQILCGHYRVIYEVLSEEQVGVLTVHHQSRLLRNNPGMKKLVRKKKRK